MKHFPFITLPASLVLLRIMLAVVFLAHAIVRITWRRSCVCYP